MTFTHIYLLCNVRTIPKWKFWHIFERFILAAYLFELNDVKWNVSRHDAKML